MEEKVAAVEAAYAMRRSASVVAATPSGRGAFGTDGGASCHLCPHQRLEPTAVAVAAPPPCRARLVPRPLHPPSRPSTVSRRRPVVPLFPLQCNEAIGAPQRRDGWRRQRCAGAPPRATTHGTHLHPPTTAALLAAPVNGAASPLSAAAPPRCANGRRWVRRDSRHGCPTGLPRLTARRRRPRPSCWPFPAVKSDSLSR